jgi:hypothetical protein
VERLLMLSKTRQAGYFSHLLLVLHNAPWRSWEGRSIKEGLGSVA